MTHGGGTKDAAWRVRSVTIGQRDQEGRVGEGCEKDNERAGSPGGGDTDSVRTDLDQCPGTGGDDCLPSPLIDETAVGMSCAHPWWRGMTLPYAALTAGKLFCRLHRPWFSTADDTQRVPGTSLRRIGHIG